MDNYGQLYNPQSAPPVPASPNLGYGSGTATPPIWAGRGTRTPSSNPAGGTPPTWAGPTNTVAPTVTAPPPNPYLRTGGQIAGLPGALTPTEQMQADAAAGKSTWGTGAAMPPAPGTTAPPAPTSMPPVPMPAPKVASTPLPPAISASPMKPVAFGTNRAPVKAMFR